MSEVAGVSGKSRLAPRCRDRRARTDRLRQPVLHDGTDRGTDTHDQRSHRDDGEHHFCLYRARNCRLAERRNHAEQRENVPDQREGSDESCLHAEAASRLRPVERQDAPDELCPENDAVVKCTGGVERLPGRTPPKRALQVVRTPTGSP